jgi:archaellum biogenesis ATPase FlaH
MDKVSARMKLKTAIESDNDKKLKQIYIQTGSKDFNNLLGGGIPTGSITGTVGRLATGKTQIAFDLIVDVLGRLKKKAVFIETEADTFYLDRLKEIAKLRGYTDINWNNLYICEADQIPTAKAQYLQYKVVQRALEKGEDIILVVVDSFNAMFRAGWSRSEMLPIRTREFGEHFTLIKYITAKWNVAWYLTFQAISAPRPDQQLHDRIKYGGEMYPVGGDFVLHTVNNWIALDQIKTELWKATLFDSSHMDRATTNFMLTASGLKDEVK